MIVMSRTSKASPSSVSRPRPVRRRSARERQLDRGLGPRSTAKLSAAGVAGRRERPELALDAVQQLVVGVAE